jgi:hypothetical protein
MGWMSGRLLDSTTRPVLDACARPSLVYAAGREERWMNDVEEMNVGSRLNDITQSKGNQHPNLT